MVNKDTSHIASNAYTTQRYLGYLGLLKTRIERRSLRSLLGAYAAADHSGVPGVIDIIVEICISRYDKVLDMGWRKDLLIDLRSIESLPLQENWPLLEVLSQLFAYCIANSF